MVDKEELRKRISENKKKKVFALQPKNIGIFIYENASLLKLAIQDFEGCLSDSEMQTDDFFIDEYGERRVKYLKRVRNEKELEKYLEKNNLKVVNIYECNSEY